MVDMTPGEDPALSGPERGRLAAAFGQRLRTAREKAGISRTRLAAAAGLDRSAMGLLERGARQPRLDTIVALARALGVDPAELVGDGE